jgi:hypothetical protein
MGSRGIALGALLALAAALSPAGGARAEELNGIATVEAKDLARGTVTLDGTEFQVGETTRLTDAAGRRIGLAELPVAERMGSAWLMSPESTVEYEATERPGGLALSSLRCLGTIPH